MNKLLIAGAAIASLSFASYASAGTFPGYGYDTGGPGLDITFNSNGTISLASTGQSTTYDGTDDTYIGVINNSSKTVNSIALSSSSDIFGFDGDGIDTYGAPGNKIDTTGYGGPLGYFTNISTSSAGVESGTINFIGGIAPGASSYFSLEESLTSAGPGGGGIGVGGVPEPSTWIMMLGGLGIAGGLLRAAQARRREDEAADTATA